MPLDNIDVYNFLQGALINNCMLVVEAFIQHPNVNKLYAFIIVNDVNAVRHNLNIIIKHISLPLKLEIKKLLVLSKIT